MAERQKRKSITLVNVNFILLLKQRIMKKHMKNIRKWGV